MLNIPFVAASSFVMKFGSWQRTEPEAIEWVSDHWPSSLLMGRGLCHLRPLIRGPSTEMCCNPSVFCLSFCLCFFFLLGGQAQSDRADQAVSGTEMKRGQWVVLPPATPPREINSVSLMVVFYCLAHISKTISPTVKILFSSDFLCSPIAKSLSDLPL